MAKLLLAALALIMGVVSARCETQLVIRQVGTSDTLIIFVHGLGGNAKTAFSPKAGGESWYGLMMKDTGALGGAVPLGEYGIATVDYGIKEGVSKKPHELSRDILDDFTRAERDLRRYQKFIFIGHSYGGLMVQQLLADAHTKEHWLYAKTKAVFFVAVPINGASFLRFLDLIFTHPPAWLNPLMTAFKSELAIHLLPVNSSTWLSMLKANWEDLRPRFVYCVYETRPTQFDNFQLVVVTEGDMNTACNKTTSAAEDHFSIAAPGAMTTDLYEWVRDRIQELPKSVAAVRLEEELSVAEATSAPKEADVVASERALPKAEPEPPVVPPAQEKAVEPVTGGKESAGEDKSAGSAGTSGGGDAGEETISAPGIVIAEKKADIEALRSDSKSEQISLGTPERERAFRDIVNVQLKEVMAYGEGYLHETAALTLEWLVRIEGFKEGPRLDEAVLKAAKEASASFVSYYQAHLTCMSQLPTDVLVGMRDFVTLMSAKSAKVQEEFNYRYSWTIIKTARRLDIELSEEDRKQLGVHVKGVIKEPRNFDVRVSVARKFAGKFVKKFGGHLAAMRENTWGESRVLMDAVLPRFEGLIAASFATNFEIEELERISALIDKVFVFKELCGLETSKLPGGQEISKRVVASMKNESE